MYNLPTHSTMALSLRSLLLLVQLLFVFPVKIPAKVPAVIVFGDSSVDAGNNNVLSTIAKSNFRPYGRDLPDGRATGRFSNGRIATDFISEAFGIKAEVPAYLDPAYTINDFATGVTFASAATGYDNATSDVLSVIPLWREVEYFKEYQEKLRKYLGEKKAKETITEAVYIISVGTNDFLENYYTSTRRSSQFTIHEYEDFLVEIAGNFVTKMYNLGARKISLGGLPPMGCFPLERSMNSMHGAVCNEGYNNVAKEFNSKLVMKIKILNTKLPGIKLVFSSVYDVMLAAIHKPSLYGFDNVARGCCSTGLFEMGYLCNENNPFTCKDASKYMFWDSFHPTEKMNLIFAYHVMKTSLARFL